jgi:hypothetical protein
MPDLPPITEVQRLTIRPGDRLIIRCEGRLTQADAAEIPDRVRTILQLPDDFPILALGSDITVEVAGPDTRCWCVCEINHPGQRRACTGTLNVKPRRITPAGTPDTPVCDGCAAAAGPAT